MTEVKRYFAKLYELAETHGLEAVIELDKEMESNETMPLIVTVRVPKTKRAVKSLTVARDESVDQCAKRMIAFLKKENKL